MSTERWKRLPKPYREYEVSSFGNIRRNIPVWMSDDGYVRASLVSGHGGKAVNELVHILIARAFLGLCPKDKEVNHQDLDKSNNKYKNLEYITHKENVHHAIKNGHGNQYKRRRRYDKLSKEDIKKICYLYVYKFKTCTKLAKKFKVSDVAIQYILRREQVYKKGK